MQMMQEMQVRYLSQEDPLEKEMATHTSTVAWRIPGTEEPGRRRQTITGHQVPLQPWVVLDQMFPILETSYTYFLPGILGGDPTAHMHIQTHTHTHRQGEVTCKNPYSKARRHGVVWHGTPRRVKREVFVDGLQRMRSIYEPHVGQKPAMDSCYRPWPSLPAFLSGHQ